MVGYLQKKFYFTFKISYLKKGSDFIFHHCLAILSENPLHFFSCHDRQRRLLKSATIADVSNVAHRPLVWLFCDRLPHFNLMLSLYAYQACLLPLILIAWVLFLCIYAALQYDKYHLSTNPCFP